MSVDISLNVRLDQLRAELEKIPGLTTREVREAVKGAELQWKRMPAAARKAAQESAQHMRSLTSSIGSISPAAGAATAAVEQLGAVLGPGMAATLGPIGLVAAAVAAIGGASYVASSRMSALVDEVALLSENTGLSQGQVIALRHAVASAGGDINKTREALATFNRVMQADLVGKTGPEVDRVLRDTIARIEAIQDPAARAAERMRVFGTESARALAGLTSGGLARATVETDGLASAIGEAAGNSAAMDESAARLSSSLDRLAVVVGDALAPNTIAAIDALSGLVTVLGTAAEAGGGLLRVLTPPGLAGMMWEYATATKDGVKSTAQINTEWQEAARSAKAYGDAVSDALFAEEELRQTREDPGYISAPRVQPGVTREQAQRRRDAIARAREEAAKVAAATKAVQDQFRKDDFADAVAEDQDRAQLAEEGKKRQAALDAEEQAAHEERMRRAQEVVDAERQIRLARIASTQAIVSGAADAIAAIDETSRVAKLAGLAEALVNFGTSITAAFAQGGPIAGPALAASVIGQLAPVISSMRALVGGGPAAPRTGGGSGGGGGGGPFGRSEYGFTGRDASGNTVVVAEYRGELYDAQSYDAIRRPGSPLRDLSRRQRVTR